MQCAVRRSKVREAKEEERQAAAAAAAATGAVAAEAVTADGECRTVTELEYTCRLTEQSACVFMHPMCFQSINHVHMVLCANHQCCVLIKSCGWRKGKPKNEGHRVGGRTKLKPASYEHCARLTLLR